MNVVTRLGQLGVIPVVKIDQASKAPQLADALVVGRLPCAEITFRTDAAEESLRQIAKSHPQVLLGAGTVISVAQAQRAVRAGAQYIVSPGFDAKVVQWCLSEDIPVLPGVATPTDIQMALNHGLSLLKFFPAEALGGIPLLEAIAAPFGDVRFVPTGGITTSNLATYLHLPMVHAVGGSWLVASRLLAGGNFAEITRLAGEAMDIVTSVRSQGGGK